MKIFPEIKFLAFPRFRLELSTSALNFLRSTNNHTHNQKSPHSRNLLITRQHPQTRNGTTAMNRNRTRCRLIGVSSVVGKARFSSWKSTSNFRQWKFGNNTETLSRALSCTTHAFFPVYMYIIYIRPSQFILTLRDFVGAIFLSVQSA